MYLQDELDPVKMIEDGYNELFEEAKEHKAYMIESFLLMRDLQRLEFQILERKKELINEEREKNGK